MSVGAQEYQTPFRESSANEAAHARRELLYDAYLDAMLAGGAEEPQAFLSRYDQDDPELLQQLLAMRSAAAAGAHHPTAGDDDPELNLPRAFGDYVLVRRLGSGGMGVVYVARQTELDREVALKIIRPEFARSATAAQRFEREAKAIARLRHPNIVTVFAVGQVKTVRYIAMELVKGRGLDEILVEAAAAGAPLPVSSVLQWAAQVADALQYAHEHGIVHRDVKPSNIRVSQEGGASRAMLLDFGLARDAASQGVTLTEAFIGSPLYVAPEQIGRTQGPDGPDARVDVYSLGVVLYQCLGGRPPFAEGSLEQVLHQILMDEPPPLRSLRPDLPREVAIIVHKAMEKAASARYPSAGALAADLRAVLELRPITAQPPGMVARLGKWARRNVAAAAAAATAVMALIVLAAVLVGQQAAARARQQKEARAALDEAANLVQGVQESRASTAHLEAEFERLESETVTRFFAPDEQRTLDDLEDRVSLARRQREMHFHRALDIVTRAERLGADSGDVAHARGRVFLARYLEATIDGDATAMAMYRDLIKQNDPTGALAIELAGGSTLALTTDPPGADVYLFRMVDLAEQIEGGDRRMIPVPLGGSMPIEPGALVMRIRHSDSPELRPNDLIVEIEGRPVKGDDLELAQAGGVTATVFSNGQLSDMALPRGLTARLTAAPLVLLESARIGRTPLPPLRLDAGDYIALLRAEGYEDQRMVLNVGRGGQYTYHIALHKPANAPQEFVRVRIGWDLENPVSPDFWIMEREVTAREYYEFLNDPATLAEIDASAEPIRMPRSTIEGIHSPRGSDGRFLLHPDWSWDWPILGISYHDAVAYAWWKTRQAQAAGHHVRFELPTLDEWVAASAPCMGCGYPFGNRFRHAWVSSCFSTPRPAPRPVMTFPIDESRTGVYDLCGSVSEWLNKMYREEYGWPWQASGSWGHGKPEAFRVYAASGMPPENFSDMVGFRLVMRFEPHAQSDDGP